MSPYQACGGDKAHLLWIQEGTEAATQGKYWLEAAEYEPVEARERSVMRHDGVEVWLAFTVGYRICRVKYAVNHRGESYRITVPTVFHWLCGGF